MSKSTAQGDLYFGIPGDLDEEALQGLLLSARLRSTPDKAALVTRVYLDSFDWRLYSAGGVLSATGGKRSYILRWRPLEGGDTLQFHMDHLPVFVSDLPPMLRGHLEPVLEMRTLSPVVTTRCRLRPFAVLNEDDKTVLRLEIEQDRDVRHGSVRRSADQSRVLLRGVRGYADERRRVESVLLDRGGAVPLARDPLDSALALVGREPADYSSKLRISLDPRQRTDEAATKILSHLLRTMEVNEPGVRADVDTEFLHDYRVAVRRTRSLLSQVKSIFPVQRVERYRREFAWLGQITSPCRDLDVYLLGFEEFRDSLPSSMKTDLTPLRDYLVRHKADEHARLVAALDSARYGKTMADWKVFLETKRPRRTSMANAMRPLNAVANERIWRMYRKVMKQGGAIDDHTPAEAVHELRKSCKKLRYLMEFFRDIYPPEKIDRLIRSLKGLQDNLGDFQDYEVQHTSLATFEAAMEKETGISDGTRRAMDHLIEALVERQHDTREAFRGRFRGFSRKANRGRFEALFRISPDTERTAA
ncbi:MAG: CHAD domain-containing protein [Pseudomonadota bacterium]|nr:CHAD domain-containing protein [Pseudomonadota bacterium]